MTPREKYVLNSMKVVAHTYNVDPEFFHHCVRLGMEDTSSGFGALLEQNEDEFNQFLQHVKGCGSALEIGSRYGESLKRIAGNLNPKSMVLSIDLPESDCIPPKREILHRNLDEIAGMGHSVFLYEGDSKSDRALQHAKEKGPFDLVFIDGDHSYEGVKADWENYGLMANKVVAFHDIINNTGCFKLWNDVKKDYRHVEYTDSAWLGIGVLFKEENAAR